LSASLNGAVACDTSRGGTAETADVVVSTVVLAVSIVRATAVSVTLVIVPVASDTVLVV
jgi:hypothetical protein